MRYFELTSAEQRSRLDQRPADGSHTTWDMSDKELDEWAADIDIPRPGNWKAVNPSMTHRTRQHDPLMGDDPVDSRTMVMSGQTLWGP